MNELTQERIHDLMNCKILKQQFAWNLWEKTSGRILHGIAYEAAESLIREMYPHATGPAAISQIAIAWVNDPIVIDTYLKISNGCTCEEFVPTKPQMILKLGELLDEINAKALQANGRTAVRNAGRMKKLFSSAGKLFSKTAGLGF